MGILKDIKSGALPVKEIPGFIAWLFRKIAWLSILIIAGFSIGLIIAMSIR